MTIHLNFDGGSSTLGVNKLGASQTAEIDFRKLRDEQVPDGMGNVIPLNVDKGQIAWSAYGGVNKVMTGRSEQISLSKGVASTYACYNPCPNSIYGSKIEPIPVSLTSVAVGETLEFTAQQRDKNNFNQIQPWYTVTDVSWESTDPPILGTNDRLRSLSLL